MAVIKIFLWYKKDILRKIVKADSVDSSIAKAYVFRQKLQV